MHVAYVGVAPLEWPQRGMAYEVRCPACDMFGELRWATFEGAFLRALQHRTAWDQDVLGVDLDLADEYAQRGYSSSQLDQDGAQLPMS